MTTEATDQAVEQSGSYADEHAALAELERRSAARAAANDVDDEGDDSDADDDQDPPKKSPKGEAEQHDDDADDEQDQDDDDQEDEDDEKKPDAEPTKALAEIEFAGKKYAVPKGTPAELAAEVQSVGQALHADYTRKTQEVAQRAAVVDQARPQLQQFAQQLSIQQQAMAQFQREMIPDAPRAPAMDLAYANPAEYTLQFAQYQQDMQKHQQALHRYQQLTQMSAFNGQQSQGLTDEARVNVMHAEQHKLLEHHPELADEGKRQAAWQRVAKVAPGYGIDVREVATTADHRVMRLLLAAAELADLKAQQSKAVKKVQAAPPPKTVKPAGAPPERAREGNKDELKKFMRSGKTEADAVRWLNRTRR